MNLRPFGEAARPRSHCRLARVAELLHPTGNAMDTRDLSPAGLEGSRNYGEEYTHEIVFCLDSEGGWLTGDLGSDRLLCQQMCIEDARGIVVERGPCLMKPRRHQVITLREAVRAGLLDDHKNQCVTLFVPELLNALGLKGRARKAS
jgi:hypothetical protein